MKKLLVHVAVLALCTSVTAYASADAVPLRPQLGVPFADNAVFQQGIDVPVWGTTLPGATVTVSFADQTKKTKAKKDGSWRIELSPMKAVKLKSVNETPEGHDLLVTCELNGDSALTKVTNIAIGEVWLCAGQSNMAGRIKTNRTRHHPTNTLELANYPALRYMQEPSKPWVVCSPETAPVFKKVAFFFARKLQSEILVPVGLFTTAVGGSSIEPWIAQPPLGPGKHYESFITPLVGYGIRGALWYQGESNVKDGRNYLPKLRSLIEGWRDVWDQGDFSFCVVQLPGHGDPKRDNPAGGGPLPELRNAQFEALGIKNTAMAITIDIGDRSIHPPNKYDTGVRSALAVLRKDYEIDLIPTGPLYRKQKIEGSSIRVMFDNAESGLMFADKDGFLPPSPTPDRELGWLSIQATDGTWHWAEGKIDGSDLLVSAEDVKKPVAVRYAYAPRPPAPFLYNKAGLPATPFTTCGY